MLEKVAYTRVYAVSLGQSVSLRWKAFDVVKQLPNTSLYDCSGDAWLVSAIGILIHGSSQTCLAEESLPSLHNSLLTGPLNSYRVPADRL